MTTSQNKKYRKYSEQLFFLKSGHTNVIKDKNEGKWPKVANYQNLLLPG